MPGRHPLRGILFEHKVNVSDCVLVCGETGLVRDDAAADG
jgi:hypothetical protein